MEQKKKKITCGLIILNELNEILLGHSTGNKWYDLPKGLLEENEKPIDGVLRECKEETNLDFQKEFLIDLGQHNYNKEKDIYLFYINVLKNDIDMSKLTCTSFFINRYTKKSTPEVDGFKWVHKNDLINYCTKNMSNVLINIFDNIIEKRIKYKL